MQWWHQWGLWSLHTLMSIGRVGSTSTCELTRFLPYAKVYNMTILVMSWDFRHLLETITLDKVGFLAAYKLILSKRCLKSLEPVWQWRNAFLECITSFSDLLSTSHSLCTCFWTENVAWKLYSATSRLVPFVKHSGSKSRWSESDMNTHWLNPLIESTMHHIHVN